MRILKIRVCSECPHHKPPTPIYPGYCSITRHESGFMGNPFEDHPKIPEWCPLEKSEPDELPEWLKEILNEDILFSFDNLNRSKDLNNKISNSNWATRINTVKWVLSLRKGD